MNAIDIIKNKPVLVGGIAFAILASIGILVWGISRSNTIANSQSVTNPISKPQPSQQIAALGRLEPMGEISKLSAPLALDGDRLKELRVKEGSIVKAGEIIAVLDAVDRLQAVLIEEEQQVNVARAKLAQIQAGAKPGELTAQKATISRTQIQLAGEKNTQQQAISRIKAQWQGDKSAQIAAIGKIKVELTNAKSELNRYQQLATNGAISQSLLDNKKLAVASLDRQLQEAQAILTRINNTNERQLQEAKSILDRIQTTGTGQIIEAQTNLSRIAEIRPVDIQAARSEVQKAIATQNRTKAELDRAYIRAPADGQILKINTRIGEKVTDRGIVDFARTQQMRAIAEVYQTDINKVKIGQTATITSQAFTGKLTGTVESIGLQVNRQNVFSDRPGENLDRRVIEVKIKLDPKDSNRVSKLTNLQVQTIINN